jgi:membrane protein required for colicin V production
LARRRVAYISGSFCPSRLEIWIDSIIVWFDLASRFYGPLAVDLLDRIFQPNISAILSFLIIFIFAIGAIGIVIVRLNQLVTDSILNWVNKFGGAVFGLLIAAIILGALLAIILKLLGDQTFITGSIIASFLLDKFPVVLSLLPSEFNAVRSFFN